MFIICIFGSDRSPRRGNVVCASVTLFKRTLKMSSSSNLKRELGRELKKELKREHTGST